MSSTHDTYFKKVFKDKEIARDFIKHFLDSTIVKHLDLDSLALLEGSFVDEKLQEHFSDVLYTCVYKSDNKPSRPVKITLLLEHKSYYDSFIGLQLLRYMLNLWEKERKDTPKEKLTPVIPIVVYHGKEGWKQRKFNEAFKIDDVVVQKFIPEFQYLLSDLGKWSDHSIVQLQAGLIRNAVLALKHSRDKAGLVQNIIRILRLSNGEDFGQLPDGFFRITSLYLLNTSQENVSIMIDAIKELPEPQQETALTMAQQLEKRGEKRGEARKNRETVLKGKELGLATEVLVQLTGLSLEEVSEILRKEENKK